MNQKNEGRRSEHGQSHKGAALARGDDWRSSGNHGAQQEQHVCPAASLSTIPDAKARFLAFGPPKANHERPGEIDVLRGVTVEGEWAEHVFRGAVTASQPEKVFGAGETLKNSDQREQSRIERNDPEKLAEAWG